MEKQTKHVGVKMPAALNHKIEQIARGENNSVSAVIRRILTAGVDREGLPLGQSARVRGGKVA